MLLGEPDAYFAQPDFSTGAWRFLAVQLGGIEAVAEALREHLLRTGRGDNPHQAARLGTVLAAASGLGTLVATIALDPHKDHEATWAIAQAAAARSGKRLLGYPVWAWRHLNPVMAPVAPVEVRMAPRGLRLDMAQVLEAKRRAVLAHRRQTTRLIADDPGGFILTDAVLSVLLRPFEVYLEEKP
jgi:LmbE family N-acetylglucosaminyl deacetylase